MKGFTSIDFLHMMIAHGIRSDVSPDRWAATPYEVKDKLVAAGVPEKVVWSCAETCSRRGYWESGTTTLGGWVTPKGIERLRELGLVEKENA